MITPIFYKGQKVVCINDDFSELLSHNSSLQVPIKDEVYTVKKNYQFTHNVGITVEEIYNAPIPPSKLCPNFRQDRFILATKAQVLELVKEEYLQVA